MQLSYSGRFIHSNSRAGCPLISVGFKKAISPDQGFKIVLFRFYNGNISNKEDWFYYPDGAVPSVTGDEIMSDDTPARRTFLSKKMEFLPDINKPFNGLRFVNPSEDEQEGSIVCYPVLSLYLDREVLAVLSIFTTKPNFFNENRSRTLNFFVQPFIKRIEADLCLLALRRKAHERA